MSSKSTEKKAESAAVAGSMFYKYAACPHWLYFDRFGDPKKKSRLTRFAEMLLEMGVLHEKKIISGRRCIEVNARGNSARHRATVKLMQEGVPCIYHGLLATGEFVGEPDILEKRFDESSDLGAYYYVPIDIKSADRLTDAHRYQLVLYGELLKRVQGVRPKEGFILNGSGVLLGFPLRDFEQQFHAALDEVRGILGGKKPPPHVSSGCKQSPWFSECIAYAEETDDIALLYNVKKKIVQTLREAGVRTVRQAVAIDAERLSEKDPKLSLRALERIALQARALIEKRHFLRGPIELSPSSVEIFFDIEGDPLRDVEYLFGLLSRKDGRERYEYMLAKKPEDEAKMWTAFLAWAAALPDDYTVYHYGTYEKVKLNQLELRHGGSAALDRFRDSMIDLNEIIKENVVFPLYFYGIKDIGAYIGFKRSKKISGGGESVAYYENWLAKNDPRKLEAIIRYNEDDVIAARFLKDWLAREQRGGG